MVDSLSMILGLYLLQTVIIIARQEMQKFIPFPFLEFGMNYKSSEFGPDLKESSRLKV